MGATSVTGKGYGDSYGKYKPENQCGGCGCGCKHEEEERERLKTGCVTRTKACSCAKIRSSGGASIKVC